MSSTDYKYFAFISYRGADAMVAKRLQRKFNNFKLPSTYINPFNENNHRMQPVCRDRDNFIGGEVSSQIRDAIDHSMYVVMVCTPNMTQNDDQTNYVNDEVDHLIKTGRLHHLIPLVYEGRAYSPDDYKKAGRPIENPFHDECLPYALRKWMSENSGHDFTLNIFNIEEQGERDEEKMFLRCVATILAEEFTKLWNRFKIEQRKRNRMTIFGIMSTVCVFAGAVATTLYISRSEDVNIKLIDISVHNPNLPELRNAIVTIQTNDYIIASDTVENLSDNALLRKVPHEYMNNDIRLTVKCADWQPIDTIVNLSKEHMVNIVRDPRPYGSIKGIIRDKNSDSIIKNSKFMIGDVEVTSDKAGHVDLLIPLNFQNTHYEIMHSGVNVGEIYMPFNNREIIIAI